MLVGYRFQSQGKLNFNLPDPRSPQIIQNNQTRTVVLKEESAVISAVEKSSPSVIAIGVRQRIVNPLNPFSGSRTQENTIGTGFVVDQGKGIIVTNRHVVSDSTERYSVVTKDGKNLEVERIYRDPNLDLAIIQVRGDSIPASLELGDSGNLKVGQTVIAIGNALGRFDNTVTTGVVSGVGRAVTASDPYSGGLQRLDDLIQTDAAINPGNSGGPLLNSSGQVIGVNVVTTEGAQNIGFSIPINSVKSLVSEFAKTGTISRPYLGIQYRLITRDLALLNEVPQGAFVQEVVRDSPAEKAGVEASDIITKIDGQAVNTENFIPELIRRKKVGDRLNLEIWRDGQTQNITATLGKSPNL